MSDAASKPKVVLASEFDVVGHSIQIAESADGAPHKSASCRADVWFTAFFDGTGDNLYNEMPKPPAQQAFSNIAKLFRAHHVRDDTRAIALSYVPGVGTAFPEIGDSGGAMGRATGYMGKERIEWAEKQLLLAVNLQKQRGFKVNTVHVAVFGFSRGATLARAFVNRLSKQSIRDGDLWRRDGARFRIYFLGIFDTVASVGLPREHSSYAENLAIPELVEQCVHLVAGHELRFAFPLDSVRRNGKYPVGTVEYVYPGVHSDVGGGYAEFEQGRTNDYAALPLCFIYQKGRMAGVPFVDISNSAPEVSKFFKLEPRLIKTYQSYMAALDATGDSIEEQTFAHLKLYWRWRKLRMNDANAPVPQKLAELNQEAVRQDALLTRQLSTLQEKDTSIARGAVYQNVPLTAQQDATLRRDASQRAALSEQIETNQAFSADRKQWKQADETTLAEAIALARTVKSPYASAWEKAVWDAWNDTRALSPDVVAFFDNYCHDSQAAWDHRVDAASVALIEQGASQTCSNAFYEQARRYCTELEREIEAGSVKYLRPRTLFFGEKEDVFAAFDTGF